MIDDHVRLGTHQDAYVAKFRFVAAVRTSMGTLDAAQDAASDGVFGLSPAFSGTARELIPPFLDQLHRSANLSARMFTLCLPAFNDPARIASGQLIVGAAFNGVVPSDAVNVVVPLRLDAQDPADSTFVSRYEIDVLDVRIGGQSMQLTPQTALVDSGASSLVLPNKLFEEVGFTFCVFVLVEVGI